MIIIQSSKKDFAVVQGARMNGLGGEGEASGITGQLVTLGLSPGPRSCFGHNI